MIALQVFMDNDRMVEMIFRGTQNWPGGETISPITLLFELVDKYPVRNLRIVERELKKSRKQKRGFSPQSLGEIELEKILWLNALHLVDLLAHQDAGRPIFYQGKKLTRDELYWFAMEGVITGSQECGNQINMTGGYFH